MQFTIIGKSHHRYDGNFAYNHENKVLQKETNFGNGIIYDTILSQRKKYFFDEVYKCDNDTLIKGKFKLLPNLNNPLGKKVVLKHSFECTKYLSRKDLKTIKHLLCAYKNINLTWIEVILSTGEKTIFRFLSVNVAHEKIVQFLNISLKSEKLLMKHK